MIELFYQDTKIETLAIELIYRWGLIPEVRAIVPQGPRSPWVDQWYPSPFQIFTLYLGGRSANNPIDAELGAIRSALDGRVELDFFVFPLMSNLRVRQYRDYENVRIRDLLSEIAGRSGLSVTFSGEFPNLELERESQDNETDLSFLFRVSNNAYIYPFISASAIDFVSIYYLDERPAIRTITPSDILRNPTPNYVDSAIDALAAVQVIGSNFTISETGGRGTRVESLDMPGISNQAEAILLAKSALSESTKESISLSIGIPSDYGLNLGDNLEMVGLGALNGKYQVRELLHNQATTEIVLWKVER